MAWLTDLPNEIILMIIPLVSPDDIESFTSTCRKIYNLAAQDLERHRSLKRQYGAYHLRGPDDNSLRCRGSQLLDEIIQEPRTAFYVQQLWNHGWFSRWVPQGQDLGPPSLEGVHRPYNEGTISRMRELVTRHVPHDEASRWMENIEFGAESPIVALLLLLLPNLTTVKVLANGPDFLYATLCRITKMTGPEKPLSRLRHVQITHCGDIESKTELNIIALYAALPSVRSIHSLRAYDPISLIDTRTDLVPRTSGSDLQDLTFTSCLIESEILYNLLKHLKALRSFTYDASIRKYIPAQPYPKFKPSRILSGLSDFARSTLESLTILSHNKKRNFMGDIRGFESLRNLHIEIQLLLDEFDRHDDDTLLVRALPPKLETLKLECFRLEDERRIARWIFTLAELKPKCVPALQKVEVLTREGDKIFNASHDDPVEKCRTYKALVEACNRQGVHLLVDAFTTKEIKDLEDNERKTCVCGREACGTMIKCFNDECQHGEVFHFTCIGVLPTHPEWYCPDCLADKQESNAEIAGGSNVERTRVDGEAESTG